MNLECIKPQNLSSLLMKSRQSNFDLRSPSSYLARSYLIATVTIRIVLYHAFGYCYRHFVPYVGKYRIKFFLNILKVCDQSQIWSKVRVFSKIVKNVLFLENLLP